MSGKHEASEIVNTSEEGQDVVALLKKMQQQLTYMEKKLDTLIAQSTQRPSRGDSFSNARPSRPSFGHPDRHSRGPRREGGFRDQRGFGQNRPFDRPQGDRDRSRGREENRPNPGPEGGQAGGFSRRKKRFFHRGRD